MEEEAKVSSNFLKYFAVAGFILIILIFIILFSNHCADGTKANECSENKPYFCYHKNLIEKSSECGCLEQFNLSGEKCSLKYNTGETQVALNYFLGSKENEINFIVYKGFYDYLSDVPKFVNGNNPARIDFKKKTIENELQREMILPLVVEIQNKEDNENKQLEIAISLVQNIMYNETQSVLFFGNNTYANQRYPYEVLYENQGICSEKSDLLALLLKEMGYGVVLFYFPEDKHEAVGVKCSFFRDFRDSGYCFIETTIPSEINDYKVSKQISSFSEFEIIPISEGKSIGLFF